MVTEALAEFPWHRPGWEQFLRCFPADRMPHAILLHGRHGCGITHFAWRVAQRLLCVQEPPCGRCRSCRWSRAGSHPDVLHIALEEGAKQIRVTQIRAVAEFLSLKSLCGNGRVCIVDPADDMNHNAANALLKILEEPPEGTVLLLLGLRPGGLLPTIRSRCQSFQVQAVIDEDSHVWLQRHCGVERDVAHSLLRVSEGAPLLAATLHAQGVLAKRDTFMEACRAVLENRAGLSALVTTKREDVLQAFEWLLGMLRAAIRHRLGASADPVWQGNRNIQVLKTRLEGLELSTLTECYEQTLSLYSFLLQATNLNARGVLEEGLLSWCEMLVD